MLIETLVISHLSGQLPGVSVVAEVPEEYTGEALVVVEKTADARNNRVMRATFALQSYGGTLLDAATLSRRVRSAMDSLVERSEVSACRFETDYNWTDETRKRYRYQAIYHITYYDLED